MCKSGIIVYILQYKKDGLCVAGGDSYAGSDIQVIIINVLDLKHVRWGSNNNMHTSNSTNG